MMTDDILNKLRVGDGLDDTELRASIKWYTELEEKLRLLGPEFKLAWTPVFHQLETLKTMKHFRDHGF